jgi:hypothetical protein
VKNNPKASCVYRDDIHQIRGRKRVVIHRWYVSLNFGGRLKMLAVSEDIAIWLKGGPEPPRPQ